MKKFKHYFIWLGLLTLTVLLTGCSLTRSKTAIDQQKTPLIVGLDDSFVPMGFRQKNGDFAGFDIDLAKAVGKKLGRRIIFQPIDWDMKETELRNGTIDLIWNGYTKTPERAKKVAFSNAYLKNQQVLVTLKQSRIQSIGQMKGKSVGLQNGSSGQADYEARPKALKKFVKNSVLYDNFNNAFLDLKAGRIQGLVADSIYARYYIKKQTNPKDFTIIATPFPKESFAVGLRLTSTHLRRDLNQALQELTADGTIGKISQKWFGEDLSIK